MHIFVDGDACPKITKEILFKAAVRTKTELLFVANHFVTLPPSPYIKRQVVSQGFDVADSYIVEQIKPFDLVITADILLAELVIQKKAFALNPRGELYSENTIKQIVSMRNFNESLRENRLISGGAAKMGTKEVQAFSNHLDKLLTKYNL